MSTEPDLFSDFYHSIRADQEHTNSFLNSLSDWFSAVDPDLGTIVLAFAAILVSVASIAISRRVQIRSNEEQAYEHLTTMWASLLDICHQNPKYLDLNYTEQYVHTMEDTERIQYEVYCYMAWGYVRELVNRKWQSRKAFAPIIHWMATYHSEWLGNNPAFFPEDEFWSLIEKVKNEPQMVSRYRPLPSSHGDVDWDVVHHDYHRHILGPFQQEMVQPDENGVIPNRLLSDLKQVGPQKLKAMQIADFGCGPGNLLPHLESLVSYVTCIDKSQTALDITREVADRHHIAVVTHHVDIKDLELSERFDLIISVSSILPPQREDVVSMLRSIRRHLAENGQLWAIMSSFDTTAYLIKLWEQHYKKLYGKKHANRVIKALKKKKRYDPQSLSYADDERNVQCYHDPDSIKREFRKAGLRLLDEPSKIYYPWSLTRKFDYGYFPDAKEKIWDWYVKAECDVNESQSNTD